MKLIPIVCRTLFVALASVASLHASTFGTLNYQARLAVDGTMPADTTQVGMVFHLLDPGGQALWWSYPGNVANPTGGFPAENQVQVPVVNGQVAITLGESSGGLNPPIPLDPVFFDPSTGGTRSGVKLRVWMSVDGGQLSQLTPDIEFASVPYAMTAAFAETVRDRSITREKLEDGAVSLSKLNEETAQFTVPVGTVVSFAGATPPVGWLLCDGSPLDSNAPEYQELALVIGEIYNLGDEAEGFFRIPDLRGKTAIGSGEGLGLTLREHGDIVGEEVYSLQVANLPDHKHGIDVVTTTNGAHTHTIERTSGLSIRWGDGAGGSADRIDSADTAGSDPADVRARLAGDHTHRVVGNTLSDSINNISIPSSGSSVSYSGEDLMYSAPFSIMQPSLVLNYIIKY